MKNDYKPVVLKGILLKADKPTSNKRIYTDECIKCIVDSFNKKVSAYDSPIHLVLGNNNKTTEEDFTNGRIKGTITKLEQDDKGNLIAECEIHDYDFKKLLNKRCFDEYSMVPRGQGKINTVDGKHLVVDYTLQSLGFCHKSENGVLVENVKQCNKIECPSYGTGHASNCGIYDNVNICCDVEIYIKQKEK
jgi:hypothetical protein